jgi:hypothetical protein
MNKHILLASFCFLHAAPAYSFGHFLPDKGRHIHLVEMRAFLTWDPKEQVQMMTMQPVLAGNANVFGWVLPMPVKPRADEMPRNFFEALAAFSLLEPMEARFPGKAEPQPYRFPPEPKIIELHAGGTAFMSDYWIFLPEQSLRLKDWVKDHGFDEAQLDLLLPYLKKGWFLAAFKLDALPFKRNKEGTFDAGLVAPLRLSYHTEKPYLPLELTKHSLKETAKIVLHTQAPHKLDLPGDFSFQPAWLDKWTRAMESTPVEKRSAAEKDWLTLANAEAPHWRKALQTLADEKRLATQLRYAKRLSEDDIEVVKGKAPYTREAPPRVVKEMRNLSGHVKAGQWLLKTEATVRARDIMGAMELPEAQVKGKKDETDYSALLPASP